MATTKERTFTLTCPNCEFRGETGQELVDHILASDHASAEPMSKAMAENHNLYNIMAKDFEEARDTGEPSRPLLQAKGGRKLVEALTQQSISEIHERCEKIGGILADNGIDGSRVSMCAMYLIGRLALASSDCPPVMFKMLDDLVDDAMKHADAALKDMETNTPDETSDE